MATLEINENVTLKPVENIYFPSWNNWCYNGSTEAQNVYGSATNMYYTTLNNTGPDGLSTGYKVYWGTGGSAGWPIVNFREAGGLNPPIGGQRTISFDYYPTSRPYLVFYSYNSNDVEFAWTNGDQSGTGEEIPVTLNTWNHITVVITNNSAYATGVCWCKIGNAGATATTSEYWIFANVAIGDAPIKVKRIKMPSTPTITATGSYAQTFTLAAAYDKYRCNLMFNTGSNYSDYFEVVNNGIYIKSGVRKVLINAEIAVQDGPSTSPYVALKVVKNNNIGDGHVITARRKYVSANGSEFVTIPFALDDVQDGDFYQLWFYASDAGTYHTVYGDRVTFITLMAIDYDLK